MFSYSQCRFLAFHSVSADYFRIICGDEGGVRLQLGAAEGLLVMQDAGAEHAAGAAALLKRLSLW